MKEIIKAFDHVLRRVPDASRIEIAGEDGAKIVVERGCVRSAALPPPTTVQPVPAPVIPAAEKAETAETGQKVLSPIVGTFYAAPSPDAEPFVKAGTRVSKGQTLCIIEAMKMMNEIESEFDGVITKICIQNGQLAEYGQVLFIIEG